MGLSNLEHGTYEMFKQGKCRCDGCRFAQQERRRLIKREYKRRRYQENPEIQREATRRWQEKNREYSVIKAREWNTKNREQYNANMRAWREKNKEKVAANNKKWREENPGGRKIYDHRRRDAAIKNGKFKITVREWNRMIARYNGCCAYCGSSEKITMDHVVPLSRGGRHSIGNVLPACFSCNVRKNAKFIVEWKKVS